jgi:glycosyltransferase involved in cell wall biosynthesis
MARFPSRSFFLDPYFHWAARRIIREFPQDDLIVHYLCPISPVQPRFPPPGYQYILGPLNGNVGYPPGFRSRTPWSARLREHFYFAIQHTAGRIFADKRNAARILIAGGERSLKAVVWAGGVVDRVTEVLDSGIPDRLLSQQPVRHSGTNTHMMAAGRLDAYKGFDLAIAAVARAGPDYLLSIHGDGTERANLEALAVRLGVAGRVRFHGWTPHDRLIAAMRGSRALLFPTLAEANGIIMQEAMMVGLPVVALNWGGPAILGANGAAVLVAPTGEISVINDLAEAIRRLASDGAYADAIARSARERAERSFAWRDVAESWSLAYADPAQSGKQAS